MTGRFGDRDLAFAAFAAAFFVFHQAVAAAPSEWSADAIDLVTPFAVLAAFGWLAWLVEPSRRLLVAAAVAAVLYVDGHGIHLSANSINRWPLAGTAADRTEFWDEIWGHLEWHGGLLGLLAVAALADAHGRSAKRGLLTAAAVLLGFGLFTSGVEGGSWWLMLVSLSIFAAIAWLRRSPIAVASIGALALFGGMLAIWAIWHGGVPQFSELGWI